MTHARPVIVTYLLNDYIILHSKYSVRRDVTDTRHYGSIVPSSNTIYFEFNRTTQLADEVFISAVTSELGEQMNQYLAIATKKVKKTFRIVNPLTLSITLNGN